MTADPMFTSTLLAACAVLNLGAFRRALKARGCGLHLARLLGIGRVLLRNNRVFCATWRGVHRRLPGFDGADRGGAGANKSKHRRGAPRA